MRLSRTRTASLAAALALLALCQLSAPVAAGRTLMDGPTKLEREQLAAQEAELAALVADGQAEHAQQAADEAAKLDDVAAEQAQREEQQLADQQAELAELAKREGAQQEEVEALEKAARQAEREARDNDGGDNGDEEGEKETRESRREEDSSSSSSDSNDSSSDNSDDSTSDSNSDSGSSGSSDGGDGSPRGRKKGDGFEMDAPRVTKESGSGDVAYATYHYYAPLYETSSLYCADVFQASGYDKASLLDRPWTAYCNDKGLGPMSQDKCGQSLCVTNTATGQTVKMVVVDLCGQGGVDMDPLGFNAIDGNNQGYLDGHMDVKLRWC